MLHSWDSVTITDIYFLSQVGKPHVGFVSLWHRNYRTSLWGTNDGGKTWSQRIPRIDDVRIMQVCFKDSMVGWAGGYGLSTGGILFRTVDGGSTWNEIPTTLKVASMLWHKQSQLLITAHWETPILGSSDLGDSWFSLDSAHAIGLTSDSTGNLIISGTYFATGLQSYDGRRWERVSKEGESFQSAYARDAFYSVHEGGSNFYKVMKSVDKGKTWNTLSSFDPLIGDPTGVIAGNDCAMYMQSTMGVFRSSDEGVTWTSIGEQLMPYDCRFQLTNNVLYAANWELYKSTLWRYVEPFDLTLPSEYTLKGCDADTSIKIVFNEGCSQAQLLQASLEQPDNCFRLGPLQLPLQLNGEYSIPLSYSSCGRQTENATLHLRIRIGELIIDSAIKLSGTLGKEWMSVGFTARLSNATPKHGEKTVVGIYPTKAASSRGVNELTFDVSYIDDLFRFEQISGSYQPSVANKTVSSGRITLPISIRAADITLDPNVPIAAIELTTLLTDTTSTDINISNVILNGGDQDFARCMLALEQSTGTEFSITLQCSDPLIQRVIRGEKAIAIISINPNPTNGSITIDYESKLSAAVTLSVYSVNGVLVHEEVLALDLAGKPIKLDASGWASGAYTIVLKSGEEEARGSVIKN
jgi:photosystem II stability/assembly factor-like uncharacterized protein